MKFVGGCWSIKLTRKAMTGPVLIGVGIVNILFGFSFRQRGGILRCTVSTRSYRAPAFRRGWRKLWPRGFEKRTGTLVG